MMLPELNDLAGKLEIKDADSKNKEDLIYKILDKQSISPIEEDKKDIKKTPAKKVPAKRAPAKKAPAKTKAEETTNENKEAPKTENKKIFLK